jgi:hypothetical protein
MSEMFRPFRVCIIFWSALLDSVVSW